jgi:hypothetical protein
MSEYEDVIGGLTRASDLDPELKKNPMPPPVRQVVHPMMSLDELRKPSPKPFFNRADKTYPELDPMEPLYLPKFLLRSWGEEKFLASPYYLLWQSEAGRAADDFRSDFKRDKQPKKSRR